jgi:hypothetical protein
MQRENEKWGGTSLWKKKKLKPQAYFKYKTYDSRARVHTQKWGGYSPAAPPQVEIRENIDVVDIIAGNVLRNLPFNRH